MQGNIYPVTGRGGEQVFPITSDKAVVISGEENKRLSEKWEDFYSKEEVNQLIPNPNLLDNTDFTNPVNQRNQVSYSGSSIYAIDRWKLFGDFDVLSRTLTFNDTWKVSIANLNACVILQRTESIKNGDVITISTKVNGFVHTKTITVTDSSVAYNMGDFYFIVGYDVNTYVEIGIESGSIVIDWVKIEKGDVATPWQPKEYSVEYLNCLRYLYYIGSGATEFNYYCVGVTTGTGSEVIFTIPTAVKMATPIHFPNNATIVVSGPTGILFNTTTGDTYTVSNIRINESSIFVRIMLNKTLSAKDTNVTVTLQNCLIEGEF